MPKQAEPSRIRILYDHLPYRSISYNMLQYADGLGQLGLPNIPNVLLPSTFFKTARAVFREVTCSLRQGFDEIHLLECTCGLRLQVSHRSF